MTEPIKYEIGGEPTWTLQELADALTDGKLGAMARWLNDFWSSG